MAKKEKKMGFFASAREQIKTSKSTFVVYTILRVFVIASMVLSVLRGDFENVFVYALALLLFLAPAVLERKLKIELPSTFEIIILLFIFSAEVLGEIHSFYVRIPHWDTMLHTMNGFLFAAVGFSLLDMINRNPNMKFQLTPFYLALVAFCFSMTIGVLWEFFEFGCDMFLEKDMQKDYIINAFSSVKLDPTNTNIPIRVEGITDVIVNGESLGLGGYLDIGLIDTMKDLLVNFVGAVVFSVIGFFYVKSRGKGKFASRFIPVLEENDADEDVKSSELQEKKK